MPGNYKNTCNVETIFNSNTEELRKKFSENAFSSEEKELLEQNWELILLDGHNPPTHTHTALSILKRFLQNLWYLTHHPLDTWHPPDIWLPPVETWLTPTSLPVYDSPHPTHLDTWLSPPPTPGILDSPPQILDSPPQIFDSPPWILKTGLQKFRSNPNPQFFKGPYD